MNDITKLILAKTSYPKRFNTTEHLEQFLDEVVNATIDTIRDQAIDSKSLQAFDGEVYKFYPMELKAFILHETKQLTDELGRERANYLRALEYLKDIQKSVSESKETIYNALKNIKYYNGFF